MNQLAGMLAALPEAPGLERLRDKVRYLALLTYVGSDAEGQAREELRRLWGKLQGR